MHKGALAGIWLVCLLFETQGEILVQSPDVLSSYKRHWIKAESQETNPGLPRG